MNASFNQQPVKNRILALCLLIVVLGISPCAAAPPPVLPKGFIDQFGQNDKADWKRKIHNESELNTSDVTEALDFEKTRAAPMSDRDEFQAWKTGPQREATGFFRVEKVDEKWWLVAPNGHLFFSTGIDCVAPGHGTVLNSQARRDSYKWLPEPTGTFAPARTWDHLNMYVANLIRKWGPDYITNYKQRAIERMHSWGFTSLGNWSDDDLSCSAEAARLPYVSTGPATWELTVPFIDGDIPDVYDGNFERDAMKAASMLSATRSDKYLIGYFIDNELPWWNIPYDVFALSSTAPAKMAWLKHLESQYGDIKTLNASWKTNFKSFDKIRWPGDKANASAKKDIVPLLKDFAQRFYSTWYKAVKSADPNHLVLGSRIPYPMDEIVEACAPNTDVLSFNHYAIELHKDFDRYYRETGKPMLIGEYGFDSLDAGLLTAYVPVASQKDRGKGFTYYTEQCAAKPYFVGAHYFQYIDEPLTGRGDGETSFNGFVSVTDIPYKELVDAARVTNARIYKVHSGKEPPAADPPQPAPK